MTTHELVRKLQAGEIDRAEVETIARALAPYLPPRDTFERNSLIRALVTNFAAGGLSGNETAEWLRVEFARFEAGGDWKAWRRLRVCPETTERRRLMWRIRIFDSLPKRTQLLEILNQEQ